MGRRRKPKGYENPLAEWPWGFESPRPHQIILSRTGGLGRSRDVVPSQPLVRIRTLGSHTLQEVPDAELTKFMLEFRVADKLISREERCRKVLNEYGLNRLSQATTNRLEYLLNTWF